MSRLADILLLEQAGQLPEQMQKDVNTLRAAGEIPQLANQSQPGFGSLVPSSGPPIFGHPAIGGALGGTVGGMAGGPPGALVGSTLGAGAGALYDYATGATPEANPVRETIAQGPGAELLGYGAARAGAPILRAASRMIPGRLPTAVLGGLSGGVQPAAEMILGREVVPPLLRAGAQGAEFLGGETIPRMMAKQALTEAIPTMSNTAQATLRPLGQSLIFDPEAFLDLFSHPNFHQIFNAADQKTMQKLSTIMINYASPEAIGKYLAARFANRGLIAGAQAASENP